MIYVTNKTVLFKLSVKYIDNIKELKEAFMMLLSIAMIVKNEEKNIERCLKALRKLDDKIDYEIVIVDTGSDDDTVKIAKKYTDKVYEHKWNNDFADMRNKSIQYCKGNWILIIDADEVLEEVDSVVQFFNEGGGTKYNCAVIQFKNVLSTNEDNILLGSLIRLFKNRDEFCYQGRVHEQPVLIAPIGYTHITLRHYGYSRESYELMEYKYERNLKLLLKDLEEGKDPIYTNFQLAQTYAMANKNDEALDAIKISYNMAKNKSLKDYLYVMHFYARDMLSRGNYDKVIEISEEALKYSDEHLDFYFMALKSYKALNKYDMEQKYIDKYFKMYKKIKDGYIVKDISVNCFSFANYEDVIVDDIINSYNTKKYKKIISEYNSIKKEKNKQQLIEIYLYALMKQNEYGQIKNYFYDKEISDKDIKNITNVLNRVSIEEIGTKSSDIAKSLMGINEKLDFYISCKYENKNISNSSIIDFEKFFMWKSEILEKMYCKNKSAINKLMYITATDTKSYISNIIRNYRCLDNLNEYSKENFMTTDLNILTLVTSIEEVLLTSKSIEKQEYECLAKRALINKINYLSIIYNLNKIDYNNAKVILNVHDFAMYDIFNAIKLYNDDKLGYIKKLRIVLDDAPEYNSVVKYFMNNVNDVEISKEMQNEKRNLLAVVEKSISENNMIQANEIIRELSKLFRFDSEVLNYKGVLKYIDSDYDDALICLGMSSIIQKNNFDTIYNIACIMEAMKRKNDAVVYYKKAYDICENEDMKNQISSVIDSINEV